MNQNIIIKKYENSIDVEIIDYVRYIINLKISICNKIVCDVIYINSKLSEEKKIQLAY